MGNLKISTNNNLVSIDGLSNLFLIGGGSITIMKNPKLSKCDVLSICSFLNTTGYAEIHDNAPGCDSLEEVQMMCGLDCTTLEVVTTSTSTTCDRNNGSVNAIGIGGIPPYTFNWSNGEITQNLNNLAAGYYKVTITDSTGCQNHHFTTVEESSVFTVEIQTVDETFSGANDGTVTVLTTGAIEPITYIWSIGETSQSLQNLTPGTYYVTVSDNSGCQNIGQAIINSFGCDCIGIHSLAVYPICYGECNGSLEVLSISNGNPPYAYLWSTGDTLSKIESLCAGQYTLTVTDEYNCLTTVEYILEEPEELIIDVDDIINVNGNDLGSISVSVRGGTGEYIYKWTNKDNFVSNQEDISNLQEGCYILELLDKNYCSIKTDSICIEDITSVQDELNYEKIYLFPNPTFNYSKVYYEKSTYNHVEYKIYNIDGSKLIETTNSNIIHTGKYKPGVYLLEFWSDNEIITVLKFVVIH